MRYWVYRDAQILGPWAREDLAQEGGLRADTLVSAEGGSMDWRCAEELADLSGLYVSSLAPSPQGPSVDYEYGVLERLQFETLGLEAENGEWLAGIFDTSGPRIHGAGLTAPAADLLASQNRVRELTDQLNLLTKRVAELEGQQPHEWPAIGKAAPFTLPDKPQLRALGPKDQGPGLTERASYPESAPALPALPSAPGEPAQAAEEPSGPEAQTPRPGWSPAVQPAKKIPKFSPTKSFRRAGDSEGPSAATPPVEPQAPPAPAFTFPAAPASAPAPAPLPVAAPAFEWNVPAPAPAGLPPAPMLAPPPAVFMAPPELQAPPVTEPPPMPPLTAPPVPSFSGGSAPTPAGLPPMTMSFSTGGAPSSSPAGASPFGPMTPSPATAGAAQPGPATQEVLARLAKPQAAAVTAAPAPKRSQKKFFIIVGALLTGLIVAGGLFFFRNAKDIKTAVDMEGSEAPMGAQPMEDSPIPKRPESEPAPQPAAQEPVSPQVAPNAAPQDERPAAVELVKGYPLYGERGTIGQWLQFSFTADPANGNVEKWDAGAVEASTFLVQYTVQPGGKTIHEAITYLFEADLIRRTVRGKNPAAVELLSGGPALQKVVKKKPAKKRRAAPPAAVVPKQLPQLPLPSDSELAPPSEDDANFQSDTVEPNL